MLHEKRKQQDRAHFLIWALSLGGFIPFGILAAIIVTRKTLPFEAPFSPEWLFIIWSAIILSFLSGIRWGLALASDPPELDNILLSVISAIITLLAIVFFPIDLIVIALLVLFFLHGIWDYRYVARTELPNWFGHVRLVLTVCVMISQILVIMALM